MKKEIRIALADLSFEKMFELKQVLQKIAHFQIIVEAINGQDLIAKLKKHTVDIVLINSQMPFFNDYTLLQQFKSNFPVLRIILTSFYNNPLMLWKYMTIGINGILFSPYRKKEIEKTIDIVIKEGSYCTTTILNTISTIKKETHKTDEVIEFSRKETEIMQLIFQEKTSCQIATKMFMSRRTVDGYRKKIMNKIGVKTSIGIVKYMLRFSY